MRLTPTSTLSLLALLHTTLVPGPLPGLAAQAAPRADGELRLRPGDAIRMEILTGRTVLPEGVTSPLLGERPATLDPDRPENEASRVYVVDDEGRVLLPVVGLVEAGNRPFSDVREEVSRAFAAEFRDGAVRLVPLLRIAVLGEVRTPGLVSADPTMALADLVAAAGGLTPSADRDDIRLVREGADDLVLDQARLASSATRPRSGDRIVVGRRSWASENMGFLLGAGASVVAAVLTALIVR